MPTYKKKSRSADEMVELTVFALLDSLPDAAFIIEPDGRILNTNALFASRFGKEPHECIGIDIYRLITDVLGIPELAAHLMEKCGKVLQAGKSSVFEDDTEIWKVSINPVRSPEGEIASLFLIIQNISEQKRAERRLQKERELRTTLLDAIPCSAIVLDSDMRLMAWNRYAQGLLSGIDDQGPCNVDPACFFSPGDIDPLREKFLEIMDSGSDDYSEIEVWPHGGAAPIWLMTRSKRLEIDGRHCTVSIGIDISERKRIEDDLKIYQTKLSLALQAANAGTWEWDPRTDEVNWSEEVWSLYGRERKGEQASLTLWGQAVHPEDYERTVQAVADAAASLSDLELEYRVLHSDGQVRWLLSRGKPIFDDDGIVVRYIGTVIDITERQHLQDELRMSKRLFDEALEAASAGVWERDLKSDRIVWSDTIWRLFGLEKGRQAPSVNLWAEMVHPDDREQTLEAASVAFARGAEMQVEYRVCHPDGSIRWVMSRGKPVINDDGSINRYLGTVIDITNRKKLEEELVESKLRFGYALDASRSGIWEWDVVTDELRWSDQVWTLYGLEARSAPLNHQFCVDTVHPDDRELASRIIKAAVLNDQAASVEYRVCHPDGSIHWLTSRGMPLREESGRVIRYIGTIIDITERKQIEIELLENRKRLSQSLEAARAGIWEWELGSNENIWSDEIWPLYGLEKSECQIPSFTLWMGTIHPDDRDRAIAEVVDASKKLTDLNIEYRVCHPDGSIHWLMSRGKPMQDEHGLTVRYIGTIIDITERKNTEIALSESKVKFNFALEATGAGVWEWDMKSDRVTWSDQIWALYGLKPKSVVPSHKLCESNVHADDRELTFETVMDAANRNVDFAVEYRVCHPDGSVHWLMCRGVPLPGTEGQASCYLGTVMDVTERRRADDELRKSREKLNFVLQKSQLGVWDLDLNDFTADRSLEYARIFGYDSIDSGWSLDKFYEHVVPEDRKEVSALVGKAFEKQENYTFECRIATADGQMRWIWVFGAFDVGRSGKANHLSGIVQDITARKTTELLLKDSEQKFRNIFEFSPVAIGIEDPEEGRLFDVNGSWLRLFGYSRAEVIGRRITDIGFCLHAEDREMIMRVIRDQGRIFNRPFEFRKKNGEIINVLISAEFIVMNGKLSLLVMMTDITLQELQQASISELEQAVADRTEQLEQEVERLNRFLNMISHEYRTPLAIIRGNLDLIDLKHKSGNYSNDREMTKIKRAIERLVEVMEVSIQESRILESRSTAIAGNFKIEPLIVSQLDAFRSMWPERTLSCSTHIGGATINGEAAQLKMAIFNLLDNARKYSPPDSPIEMECRLEGGDAVIVIRNQGTGVIGAQGEEFFEKYRRGSNAVNTGGAGIGLWLVRNIVEQHHGQVYLAGTESGVEATVRLPLVPPAFPQD